MPLLPKVTEAEDEVDISGTSPEEKKFEVNYKIVKFVFILVTHLMVC